MSRQLEFDGNAILAVLARHEVACVVIGNYAGLLRGVDLATEDVDITPATTAENLERLAGALAELDAAIRVPGELPLPCPPTAGSSPKRRSGTSRPALATSISPPARAVPRATKICSATPTLTSSPLARDSMSPRSRTSSAARPPPVAPKTSPPSPSSEPCSSAGAEDQRPDRSKGRPGALVRNLVVGSISVTNRVQLSYTTGMDDADLLAATARGDGEAFACSIAGTWRGFSRSR